MDEPSYRCLCSRRGAFPELILSMVLPLLILFTILQLVTDTLQVVMWQRDSSSGVLSSPSTTKLGTGAQPVGGLISGLAHSSTTGKLFVLMESNGGHSDDNGGGFVVLDISCGVPTPTPAPTLAPTTTAPTPSPTKAPTEGIAPEEFIPR